ncbi:hypothetical protein [Anaerobiospirillum thomasii]|uniref:Auto-transporter adhesin head GIN domain-containing protein n=1 Tax=Anaerobiospirillum thomasii TaxID=179995 RepID=A0A2X0V7D5_9GAMM|nr:hypothetical protein [Anaerobiospirillum thomasii]SPT68705.1 Uncharacterised protein [Anaerobiospirillum thomasii]
MLKKVVIAALCLCSIHQATANDVCSLYLQRYHNSRSFVSVDIASVNQGRIELVVLGQSRNLYVTVNGIDVNNTLEGIDEIICSNRRAGEIRVYNLHKLAMDAGFFEARVTGASSSDTAQTPYSLH